MVNNLLKSILAKSFKIIDAFPTRQTNKEELNNFIKLLYPISTDKKLIRIGPNGDGGYLIPDDIEGIKACFSPGVSSISGFEKELADKGIKIFMADKSVDGPAEKHDLFYFTKKFLGATSNNDFMTIDEWVTTSLTDKWDDLILQMDIEGYEHEVILSASENLMNRFRIIIAEFHYLDMLWSKPFFMLARRAFDKLLQTHSCVHIHPNNCCGSLIKDGIEIPRVMEFTFLRKDRISTSGYQNSFPNEFDYDNENKPSIILPECWYGK